MTLASPDHAKWSNEVFCNPGLRDTRSWCLHCRYGDRNPVDRRPDRGIIRI